MAGSTHSVAGSLLRLEPAASSTTLYGEIAVHQVEGIPDGLVPSNFRRHANPVDEMVDISSSEDIQSRRHLARRHGLFCGPVSGAHLLLARTPSRVACRGCPVLP